MEVLKAMGFNVVLQDEFGAQIGSVDDPRCLLDKLLPTPGSDDYPFLGSIDPYGDTTFNTLQMPRFLKEWTAVVSPSASTSEEQALVASVELLARRCRDEVHVYLKF